MTKKKKRTKRTDLNISATGCPGLPDLTIQKKTDEETAMQAEMNEIRETDEKRNDLESFIFTMRDKTAESGEYGPFTTQAERERFHAELTKAEDWLYDTSEATKVMFVEKLDELKTFSNPIVFRFREDETREDWIKALEGTAVNYKAAAQNPGDKYNHIAPEKLNKIVAECDAISAWLADMKARQSSVPKHEKPILICADIEKKNQDLAKFADEILREPKPKPAEPPKEEKKAETPEAKPESPKAEAEGKVDDVD